MMMSIFLLGRCEFSQQVTKHFRIIDKLDEIRWSKKNMFFFLLFLSVLLCNFFLAKHAHIFILKMCSSDELVIFFSLICLFVGLFIFLEKKLHTQDYSSWHCLVLFRRLLSLFLRFAKINN